MDYMLLTILFSTIFTLSGCGNTSSAADKSVATDTIKRVLISGDASQIRLTTQEGQPLQATMTAKPSGWRSGWFYSECKNTGDMTISGTTLLIKAQNSDWYDLSECSTSIQANIPHHAAVTIEQPAFKADLQGQFANLNISTRAADISLQGSATKVKISGDAFRTRLQFDDTAKPQHIEIAGRALDTSLSFPKGTVISYQIRSRASLLDSKLPNTEGAKPEILILGDYARTEIR